MLCPSDPNYQEGTRCAGRLPCKRKVMQGLIDGLPMSGGAFRSAASTRWCLETGKLLRKLRDEPPQKAAAARIGRPTFYNTVVLAYRGDYLPGTQPIWYGCICDPPAGSRSAVRYAALSAA